MITAYGWWWKGWGPAYIIVIIKRLSTVISVIHLCDSIPLLQVPSGIDYSKVDLKITAQWLGRYYILTKYMPISVIFFLLLI